MKQVERLVAGVPPFLSTRPKDRKEPDVNARWFPTWLFVVLPSWTRVVAQLLTYPLDSITGTKQAEEDEKSRPLEAAGIRIPSFVAEPSPAWDVVPVRLLLVLSHSTCSWRRTNPLLPCNVSFRTSETETARLMAVIGVTVRDVCCFVAVPFRRLEGVPSRVET